MLTVGIDVGSITTKAAVANDGEVIADRVVFTGYNVRDAGQKVFEEGV
jgi:activator of 2-hydroxyglutaryl-CoA dehydratase